jgi:sigma-B regulation protein RsbU (phosphoserine phosphatase)
MIRSAAALLLCMSAAPFWSQPAKDLQSPPATWSMDRDRVSEVSLDGLWRFHPGDDPDGKLGWAQPNFDDSKWALIRPVGGWNEQGYQNMGGFAWYRVKVEVADESPLSLYIPFCDNSYEIYADGNRIGGLGGMPPHQLDVEPTPRTFALPALSSGEPRVLSIAIRVWVDPWMKDYAFGGLENGALIGNSHRIRSQVGLIKDAMAWEVGGTISVAALETLVGFASVALFLLRRREKESLWFGLSMILQACLGVVDTTYQLFHVISFRLHDSITTFAAVGSELALIAFYFRLLRGTRNWLFWLAVLSPVVLPLQLLFYFGRVGNLLSPAALNTIGTLHYLPISIWILLLLIRRSIEGMPDARLLLGPALLQESAKIVDGITQVMQQAGLIRNIPGWFERTLKWPFTLSFPTIADAFFILAILAVLIYRFTRTRQQEEKLSNELEAAREVQQVLIPAEMPPVRGFKVESVYIPASQVGGGFFQIIPVSDGDRRRERKGNACRDDRLASCGHHQDTRALHRKSGQDSSGHEPAHAGKEQWRIHDVPGDSCQSSRDHHSRKCRSHSSLSGRAGNLRRIRPSAWINGRVGLSGVPDLFRQRRPDDAHDRWRRRGAKPGGTSAWIRADCRDGRGLSGINRARGLRIWAGG